MQQNPPRTADLSAATPRQLLSKSLVSTAARGGLLLVGLLGIQISSHADALTTYNIVADYIDNTNSSGATSLVSANTCSVASVGAFAGSTRADIQISAWSSPSSGSTIFGGIQTSTGFQSVGSTGTLATTEAGYSRTITYGNPASTTVGIYTNTLPFGGSSNTSFKYRNYRVRFLNSGGGQVTSSYPSQLVYTNVANNGTYAALPSATDPTTNTTFTGFQGTATPVNPTSFPVAKVYLSLQQPNGSFWGGPSIGWSDKRINHEATRSVINSSSQQIRWTKIGNGFWPSGSNLPSGQYTLSTMARCNTQGGGGTSGPGLLNTIQFNVGATPTPTPAAPIVQMYAPQTAVDLSTGYTSPVDSTRVFTGNYVDYTGYTNINEAFILVRLNAEALATGKVGYGDALHFRYVRGTNRLYIVSTDGTSWLGGHLAASDNLLLNGGSAGFLRCLNTTTTPAFGGNNNILQINWAMEPFSGYTGAKYIRMGLISSTGAVVTINDARKDGRWNIAPASAFSSSPSASKKYNPSFNQASFIPGSSKTSPWLKSLLLTPSFAGEATLIDTATQSLVHTSEDLPVAFVTGGKFNSVTRQFELSFNAELDSEVASVLNRYSATIDGKTVTISTVTVEGTHATLTLAGTAKATKNVEVTFNALKSNDGDTIPNSSVLVDIPAANVK
ncbi:hypothetical protein EON83_25570 [bacterium]|nr:MAG: hypothetical protein EON83_25570 [bacterium]